MNFMSLRKAGGWEGGNQENRQGTLQHRILPGRAFGAWSEYRNVADGVSNWQALSLNDADENFVQCQPVDSMGRTSGPAGSQATLACSAEARRVKNCSRMRHSRTF